MSGQDQQFLFLVQDSFLTQYMIGPSRGENVFCIVLSSQNKVANIRENVHQVGIYIYIYMNYYFFSTTTILITSQRLDCHRPPDKCCRVQSKHQVSNQYSCG